MQQHAARKAELFDHLVGEREQRWRHGDAEHPNNQLELGRLQDRQIRRQRAFEDAPGIDPDQRQRFAPSVTRSPGTGAARAFSAKSGG
jgi:hypothetical protein